MDKVYYKTEKEGKNQIEVVITPCIRRKWNTIRKGLVGTSSCVACSYFYTNNLEEQYVTCKKKITNRPTLKS